MSKGSLESLRRTINDTGVSKLDANVPCFAQTWSHCASQISQEHVFECELSQGPYEDRSGLLKRLSTVHDGDSEETDATVLETREPAQSKPNENADRWTSEQTIVIASSGSKDTLIALPHLKNQKLERPTPPPKVDSGYALDASFRVLQLRESREAGRVKGYQSAQGSSNRLSADEGVSLDDDGKSLYTFEQVLRSPGLLSCLSTLSPPITGNSNKHSSQPKPPGNRRGSSNTVNNSSDSAPPVESTDSSPKEQNTAKMPKKLRKPMPAHVRKERKAQTNEMKKEKKAMQGHSCKIPTVADEMVNNFAQRSPQPYATPTEMQSNIPAELSGESPSTDSGAATPRRSPSRERSKSRGRDREHSCSWSWQARDDVGEVTVQGSWSITRKRSKTALRSGSIDEGQCER